MGGKSELQRKVSAPVEGSLTVGLVILSEWNMIHRQMGGYGIFRAETRAVGKLQDERSNVLITNEPRDINNAGLSNMYLLFNISQGSVRPFLLHG